MKHLALGFALLTLFGCGGGDPNFSLLPETDVFQQSTSSFNNKIDIIWMVDASGTMVNHQSNLANNFTDFIGDFVGQGYDYRMVVSGVDAWIREYDYNAGTCSSNPNPTHNPNLQYYSSADCNSTYANFGTLTQFRDGDIYGIPGTPGARSGTYLLTSAMPPATVLSTFATNIRTGTRGDGVAEAGLQSLRSILRRNSDGSIGYGGETHTVLSSFRRPDAFLAVIIVTDEEDQSRKQNLTNYSSDQEYVDEFVTFMDGYTGGVPGNRKYNVNGIILQDINNCPYGLHPQATQGNRYMAISAATNGVIGSICSTDFSQQLNDIARQIITLSSRFQLSREPVMGSIVVTVNGVNIPENPSNGWAYVLDSGFHYVEFRGSAIPPQGASIVIDYDPATF